MKRLFGTDGIRGVAGEFPLDDDTLIRIGTTLARSLGADTGRPPRLVLGRDTRESGPRIEAALVDGITAGGGQVDRGGVLTTPAIACLTRLLAYDGGMVISASHNPYRDNGIKVFTRSGQKLPDAVELAIERAVLDGGGGTVGADVAPATSQPPPPASPERLRERYLDWLQASADSRAALVGWSIVLDCANGAASSLAPAIFRRLGAEVTVINDAPDGRNINEGGGALHPEGLAAAVRERGARLGLAFDGDADRCLAVDATGRILDGDYLLFLAARDLHAAGGLPRATVVGTVMSNLWLERALRADGIDLLRAPVGDKYVLEEMLRGGHPLGGEQSGHIIFLERATTGDGILTGLLFAGLLQRTGLDLAAWASTVRPCPQVLLNVPVRERPPIDLHPVIGPAVLDEQRRLGDRGRVLVRYSGTEPKARVMVEGESRHEVESCAARLVSLIERTIGRSSS